MLNGAARSAIAAAALARIRNGETLMLDGGSTVAELGRLRVITGDLPLILLGGVVRPLGMDTTGLAARPFVLADANRPGRAASPAGRRCGRDGTW